MTFCSIVGQARRQTAGANRAFDDRTVEFLGFPGDDTVAEVYYGVWERLTAGLRLVVAASDYSPPWRTHRRTSCGRLMAFPQFSSGCRPLRSWIAACFAADSACHVETRHDRRAHERRFRLVLRSFVVAVALVAPSSASSSPLVFDLNVNWSDAGNPNGVWSDNVRQPVPSSITWRVRCRVGFAVPQPAYAQAASGARST